MQKKVLIVVVVYQKNITDIKIINEAISNNYNVLIYDNSILKQDCSYKAIYIHDKENSGVSKAYNKGIKLARKLNKKYIFLLDQDTKINLSALKKYEPLIERYGEDYIYSSIIGKQDKIYSPFIEQNFKGKYQKKINFKYKEIYNIKNKSLINSGLLIPLKIVSLIGEFNQNIKLDFSDMYFIEKYKKYKEEIILVDNFIQHSISGDEGKNKFKEINRFKFYCNGAREFFNETKYYSLVMTPFLRMFKLILKYKTIIPFMIYLKYFCRNKKI